MRTIKVFLLTAALVVATGATSAMADTTGSSKSTQPHPKMETMKMTHMGLFVRLDAKPGKEAALEKFLKDALPLAQAETGTPVWYAVKFGPSSFAIFDAFQNDGDRTTHLNGPIAAALMQNADELLATPPVIERWDVLAVK